MPSLSAKRSPWMERAFSLLEEAPRPREWLIAQISGLVPPGMAWRERELARLYPGRTGGPLSAEPGEVTDAAIRTGARRIVTKTIWTAVRDGTLETYDQDGERWIRRLYPPPPPRSQRQKDAARRNVKRAQEVWASDAMREVRSMATKKAWETRRAKQK